MLRSIKEMLDYSILATDGEIGHVTDILLSDSDLKARYLVKEAPPYDPDAAIPREYEARLHDYYGWPYYWQP